MRVGIDLGTAYSLIAIEVAGQLPELAPDCIERQVVHTPSVVCLTGKHALVGREAERAFDNDTNLSPIRFFKRDIGNSEPIWRDSQGIPWHAETIAALVLKKLRFDAEMFGMARISGAVITVPAHFVHSQRNAVIAAAMLAEIPVIDLIDEPIAAALHYRASSLPHGDAKSDADKPVFVFDFGGGTFDATVLNLGAVVEVKSKLGITHMGGKDLDDKVMQLIVDQFESALHIPFDPTARNLLELRRAAEDIKIDLCIPGKSFVQRDLALCGRGLHVTIRRSAFENAISDLVEQTILASKKCIAEADISTDDIGTVLMVGGGSWIPLVRQRIAEVFPWQKVLLHDPTKAVAIGAGLWLKQFDDNAAVHGLPIEFSGKTGYCVGVRALDNVSGQIVVDTLITRNQSLPARAEKRYFTSRPDQTQIKLEIIEYHDSPEQASIVGELLIGPLANPRLDYPVDVIVEYGADGIITVKAYDPETRSELVGEFGEEARDALRFRRQESLLRSMAINGI